MQAQIKVGPKVIVTVEGKTQEDLFREVAGAQEIFGEDKCGLCGSTDVFYMRRNATKVTGKKSETFEFFECRCKACNARLEYGRINDDSGRLYPKRRLIDGERPPTKEDTEKGNLGEYGKHQGWTRWWPKRDEDVPTAAESAAPPAKGAGGRR